MSVAHRVREAVARRARTVPLMTSLWARYRRRKYERTVGGFLRARDGRAGRLPQGVVYEATMRCNLHCEFCYVGDLLNIEGEWRAGAAARRAARARSPISTGLQVSLTGGEIFMRKDILDVLDLFREKGYVCGYLTTNGTIITEERAEALADLARAGLPEAHQRVDRRPRRTARPRARREGHVRADGAGLRRLQEAARRKHAPLRVSINTTVAHESLDALDADGRRRRGARRRRHRPQPPDVQHARGSRRNRAAHRRAGRVGDRDLRHAGSRARRRARAARRSSALAAKCRERNIRFDMRPEGAPAADRQLLHAGHAARRPLPLSVPARARVVQRQGLLLPVHPRRGRRPDDAVARGGLERRALRRRCAGGCSSTASFPVCRRCCKVELSPEPVAATCRRRRRAGARSR